MFSKNVQNILFTLAILIILYGAYKALFTVQEGKKDGSRRRKSKRKSNKRKRKSNKSNKRKRKSNTSNKRKRISNTSKKGKGKSTKGKGKGRGRGSGRGRGRGRGRGGGGSGSGSGSGSGGGDGGGGSGSGNKPFTKCTDVNLLEKCNGVVDGTNIKGDWVTGPEMKKQLTDETGVSFGLAEHICRNPDDGTALTDQSVLMNNVRNVVENNKSFFKETPDANNWQNAVFKDNGGCCPHAEDTQCDNDGF